MLERSSIVKASETIYKNQRLKDTPFRRKIPEKEPKAMTISIAAQCVYGDKPAFILCCDWQGTSYFNKAESLRKLRQIGKRSSALLAGDISDADELLNECDRAVRTFEDKSSPATFDLDINEFLESLREGCRKQKRAKVAHYITMKYGISSEDFWKNGKQFFTEAEHKDIIGEIKNISLGADLIICCIKSYDREGGIIVRVDAEGKPHWEDSYSTIGTGSTIAEAVLAQYDFTYDVKLEDCLFRLWIAKKVSEGDPNVGKNLDIEILLEDGSYELTEEGDKYFEEFVDRVFQDPSLKLESKHIQRYEGYEKRKV